MQSPVYISDFQILEPPHFIEQKDSFRWIEKAYAGNDHTPERIRKLISKVACSPLQISKRGHYLEDFNLQSPSRVFHLENGIAHEKLKVRMDFFNESMSKLFSDTYVERKKPEQLIHVTCSGYVSPSPAQKVFTNRPNAPTITHCYHMGCYASIPALRMGLGFMATADDNESCDIFHTELCSLHFQAEELNLEQIVIQSLFADGTAVYKLSKIRPTTATMEILYAGEKTIPNSSDHMGWTVSENGFAMTLSKDVPSIVTEFLKEKLATWSNKWIEAVNLEKNAIWAVHPGGPKILDSIKDTFNLREEQIAHSRKVLFERGNMSSATLPHIWNEILEDRNIPDDQLVVSLAFGPGLTVAASLMRVLK